MRLRFHIPRFGGSTLKAGPNAGYAVTDGRDVVIPNRWNLPAHSVAVVGRPAVSFSFAFSLPQLALGFIAIPAREVRWEQDIGGHLFVAVTGSDAAHVTILEAGPTHANGTGALVPFCYPEDTIAERGIVDFSPLVIPPPNGLSEESFAKLMLSTQRTYDGDQRYTAIELPFLFVGRDSNSYTAGALLCAGLDARAVPKPHEVRRHEWTGYPGLNDPVHLSNFGTYRGAPTRLPSGAVDIAYHNADGSVRFVVVGGEPNAQVGLPSGETVTLDDLGRIVFAPDDAHRHRLPSAKTVPPANISGRRHFPDDPAAAGGLVTLIADGLAHPLEPGARYRGRVVERHDALSLATLRTASGDIVLPMDELGVEMRDPQRVDALFRTGIELTVGLQGDRHPKLIAHGTNFFADRLRWRRLHAPRGVNVAVSLAAAGLVGAGALFLWSRRPS